MKSVEPSETADWLGVFENMFNASHGVFEDGKISIWDYSNSAHFDSLWKSLENNAFKKASRVLIIWNKTPSDESLFPVNTSEHVSPLHWAACVAKEVSQIQVCVVDLNPTAHRNEYLYEHYLCSDKSRLAWLRVAQAAHLFGIENTQGEFETDASTVEMTGLLDQLFPKLESKKALTKASQFVDRIREELTSPKNAENRHAISNIIGSMILRGGRPLSAELSKVIFAEHGRKVDFPPIVRGMVSHRFALNSILQAAGLLFIDTKSEIPREDPEEPMDWLALQSECDLAGLNPQDLRITLVDDQWQQGWLAWIKEGLGTAPIALQVTPDPDFLLHQLRRDGLGSKHFGLSLDFCGNQQKDKMQDILLLDLRLFTSNPTAEREFAVALEAVLTTLSINKKSSIDKHDLTVVSSRLQTLGGAASKLSDKDHARYLTVLPRMIAQMDFSLPIIIFSSTGQRDVLEQFKNFPNIITIFSKPRHFQGGDEEVMTRTEGALAESFGQAIRWLRGRKLVQQIQSCRLDALEKARKRCAGYSHFELYFDESGKSSSSGFRCAALLIGYKDDGKANSPDEDAKHIHRQIEKAGINLWQENNVTLQENYTRNPSGQWEAVAHGLTEIFGERPLIPFVISRTPFSTEECGDLDLAHPDALDNALFDLLELILEIALVEVLPAIHDEHASLTLHIYGACRLQTLDLKATDEETAVAEAAKKWDLLKSRYGLQKDTWEKDEEWLRRRTKNENGKWCFLYRSLRADSFLPMLARCMGNRISSKFTKLLRPAIKTVIGVQLPKNTRPTREVRNQHYICDRLATFSKVPHHNFDSIDLGLLKDWPPIQESGLGYLGRRSAAFLRLVECGRQLDAENIPLAFALGQAILGCEGVFPEAIASRLQAIIPKLSAESFNELCGLLPNISELNKISAIPADKFRGKQKTAHQMQPAARNEFRGTKQQKTFPQQRAYLKSNQLPASALRDLEEAMDRTILPSQRDDQSRKRR